ncbi:sel1 repeat family protein [Pelomyxa schiedti]|nr:sel1 repeat family protein [Pelomyxa schiedti]
MHRVVKQTLMGNNQSLKLMFLTKPYLEKGSVLAPQLLESNVQMKQTIFTLRPRTDDVDMVTARRRKVLHVVGHVECGCAEGTDPRFKEPYQLCPDTHGTLYFSDYSNKRLCVLFPDRNLNIIKTNLGRIYGMALSKNALAYSERHQIKILELDKPDLDPLTIGDKIGSTDGPLIDALFTRPSALTFDYNGNLWVAQSHTKSVRVIVFSAESVFTVLVFSEPPTALCCDKHNNLYIAVGNRILKAPLNSEHTTSPPLLLCVLPPPISYIYSMAVTDEDRLLFTWGDNILMLPTLGGQCGSEGQTAHTESSRRASYCDVVDGISTDDICSPVIVVGGGADFQGDPYGAHPLNIKLRRPRGVAVGCSSGEIYISDNHRIMCLVEMKVSAKSKHSDLPDVMISPHLRKAFEQLPLVRLFGITSPCRFAEHMMGILGSCVFKEVENLYFFCQCVREPPLDALALVLQRFIFDIFPWLFKVYPNTTYPRDTLVTKARDCSNDSHRLIVQVCHNIISQTKSATDPPASSVAIAHLVYGFIHQEGLGAQQDYTTAARHFLISAQLGNSLGNYYIATCYFHGHGVSQQLREGVRYLQLAVQQNNPIAQSDLAYCYRTGYAGVELNLCEAVRLWTISAGQSCPIAQNQLALCYEEGKGVDKNIMQAITLYEEAAYSFQLPDAQFNLADCFLKGEKLGILQDMPRAVALLEQARAQGHKKATIKLKRLGVG